MIIKLIISTLAIAVLLYYALVLLDAFNIIRWTKEKGQYSYTPFYYFFKKASRSSSPSKTLPKTKK
ncbi:MAG: hypothetical protein LBL07_03795 [Tannerella sp.]|jgi:hypothetical protein|nr:hypothetical protein [Tannerella sp.]